MKVKDFEEAVSRLAKMTEMQIEPNEVRIRKGQVTWYVCKSEMELLVFDRTGRCYRSCRDIENIDRLGDIHYINDGSAVSAYGVLCSPDAGLNLKFEEPCT